MMDKTRLPFHNAPDPYFFFPSRQHRAACDLLLRFLRLRKGLFLLMGKIGTGKTTLCRYIQQKYGKEFSIFLFSNPFLTPQEFQQKLVRDLKLDREQDFLTALQERLIKLHKRKRNPVLFLDEGHLLGTELFEFLLILSNLQANSAHLIQIVLAGQPEMEALLQQPRFASLYQRIGGRIFLTGLGLKETHSYILYRLHRAGLDDRIKFSFLAAITIYSWTKGIPRLINKVCDLCLDHFATTGFPATQKEITYLTLRKAVLKNEHSTFRPPASRYRILYFIFFAFVAFLLFLPRVIHAPAPPVPLTVTSQSDDESSSSPLPLAFNSSRPLASSGPNAPLISALQALRQEINDLKTTIAAEQNNSQAQIVSAAAPDQNRTTNGQDDFLSGENPEADDYVILQEGLDLSAIVWDEDPLQRCAVINDLILHQDETVAGYKIVAIEQRAVKLQKNGQNYILRLKNSTF
jgi:general secretion pathway protein A